MRAASCFAWPNLIYRQNSFLHTHTPSEGFVFPKPIIYSSRHLRSEPIRRRTSYVFKRFAILLRTDADPSVKRKEIRLFEYHAIACGWKTERSQWEKRPVEVKWIEKSTRANFTSNFPTGLFCFSTRNNIGTGSTYFFITCLRFHCTRRKIIRAYLTCSWLWWYHTRAHCSVYSIGIELGRQTASPSFNDDEWMVRKLQKDYIFIFQPKE